MSTKFRCSAIIPYWMEIDGKKRNLNGRKFCIECSPFKSHNTSRTVRQDRLSVTEKKCTRCKKVKSVYEFYVKRKGIDYFHYCKLCSRDEIVERQRKLKQAAIKYKGGKCQECDYDRYAGALVFHHRDPNCHAEEHGKMNRSSN